MDSAEVKLQRLQMAIAAAADYAASKESGAGERSRLFVAGLAGALGTIFGREDAAALYRILNVEPRP